MLSPIYFLFLIVLHCNILSSQPLATSSDFQDLVDNIDSLYLNGEDFSVKQSTIDPPHNLIVGPDKPYTTTSWANLYTKVYGPRSALSDMTAIFSSTPIAGSENYGRKKDGLRSRVGGYNNEPLILGSKGEDKINPYRWSYKREIQPLGIEYNPTKTPTPTPIPKGTNFIGDQFYYRGFKTSKAINLWRKTNRGEKGNNKKQENNKKH